MYDPELATHTRTAADRLESTLNERAPHLAPHALAWFRSISPDGSLASYFTHERRFPMLLLPWWLAEKAGTRHEGAFHGDVAYSTVAGYLSIRLLDDMVDGPAIDQRLLPLGVILNGEFQRAYDSHFAADHPFWQTFTAQWYGAADFACDHDAARDFELRVERRLGPAIIPLAAVAHHAGRPDLLATWQAALQGLARLEQLLDDLTDWVPDAERGSPNLMLASYGTRSEPGEALAAWVVRDGLDCTLSLAKSWLDREMAGAVPLESPGLNQFLESRRVLIARLRRETEPGLRELARLRAAFE